MRREWNGSTEAVAPSSAFFRTCSPTHMDEIRRELPLEPPETTGKEAECSCCHQQTPVDEITQFRTGDQVCDDCLRSYLEKTGRPYCDTFAQEKQDFIDWWSREYISYQCRDGLLREAFEAYPPSYRQQVYGAFAWACGQEYREYVADRLGGGPWTGNGTQDRKRGEKTMYQHIRTLRKQAHMTQQELADRAGISRTTLSGLETGAVQVTTTATLQLLANVLGCGMGAFFREDCGGSGMPQTANMRDDWQGRDGH